MENLNDSYIDNLILSEEINVNFKDSTFIDTTSENKVNPLLNNTPYYNTPPFKPIKRTQSFEDLNLSENILDEEYQTYTLNCSSIRTNTAINNYVDVYLNSAIYMTNKDFEDNLYKVKLQLVDYLYQDIVKYKTYFGYNNSVINITNLKDIWKLITLYTRINYIDYRYLKTISNRILSLINTTNFYINEFNSKPIVENEKLIKIEKLIKSLEEIQSELMYIYNNLMAKIRFINSLPKEYSNNTLNNDYSTNNLEWLDSLINIYKKNGGTFPTTSLEFFKYLKNEWENIPEIHKKEVISIIEHILGGKNIKSLEIISKNLEDWFKRNSSILSVEYRNYIIIKS